MNAAIYARVSTAAQAEHGYSLETQIEACKQKALSLGATSIKEYVDDGYSGAYMERPALDNLRDALSALSHSCALEKFTHLIEKHYRHAFSVLAQHDGPDGRHRHEEFFVEDLLFHDSLESLPQNVMADRQIWHHE